MVLICTWTGVVSGKASKAILLDRDDAGHGHGEGRHQHRPAMPQRPTDQPIRHDPPPRHFFTSSAAPDFMHRRFCRRITSDFSTWLPSLATCSPASHAMHQLGHPVGRDADVDRPGFETRASVSDEDKMDARRWIAPPWSAPRRPRVALRRASGRCRTCWPAASTDRSTLPVSSTSRGLTYRSGLRSSGSSGRSRC